METSTELIHGTELHKISKGRCQERHFFLFDHQLVYCKKVKKLIHLYKYTYTCTHVHTMYMCTVCNYACIKIIKNNYGAITHEN